MLGACGGKSDRGWGLVAKQLNDPGQQAAVCSIAV
jgi:hypothetical protein